jgi:hypothetical protein
MPRPSYDELARENATLKVVNAGLRRIVDELFAYVETTSKIAHSSARSSFGLALVTLACLAGVVVLELTR